MFPLVFHCNYVSIPTVHLQRYIEYRWGMKKPRFLSTTDTVSMEHYLLIGMSAIQGLWDCRIIECIVLVSIQGFVFPRFRIPYCNVAAKSDIDLIQICRSSAAIVCGSSNKQHDVRRIKVCARKRKTHCVH